MTNTPGEMENVVIKAEIPKDLYERLLALAKKQNISANTALTLALERDLFLSKKEDEGGQVLIEDKGKTLRKFVWK